MTLVLTAAGCGSSKSSTTTSPTSNGAAIRFGTAGSVAITYSGSVSGNYQTPKGGGPWSASESS